MVRPAMNKKITRLARAGKCDDLDETACVESDARRLRSQISQGQIAEAARRRLQQVRAERGHIG